MNETKHGTTPNFKKQEECKMSNEQVQALNISFNKEALRPMVKQLIGEFIQEAALKSESIPSNPTNLNVIAQTFGFIVCKCGHVGHDTDNFCSKCSAKLHETCPRCWQKEGQPSSCPGDKCPPRI